MFCLAFWPTWPRPILSSFIHSSPEPCRESRNVFCYKWDNSCFITIYITMSSRSCATYSTLIDKQYICWPTAEKRSLNDYIKSLLLCTLFYQQTYWYMSRHHFQYALLYFRIFEHFARHPRSTACCLGLSATPSSCKKTR